MTTPYYFTGNNPKGPILILAHGATMTHFDQNHILVKTIKPISSHIISLDLPGHGKSQLKGGNPMNFETALHDMQNTINSSLKVIKNQVYPTKIGFIGFSLGGMFAIHMKNPPFDFAIYMGCGTFFDEINLKKISMFFSEETYRRFNLIDKLHQDHGPYWQIMLKMINSWFSLESDMVKKKIKIANAPSLFILAENDQTFDSNSIKLVGNYDIITIPGDHFTYFNKKPFDVFKQSILSHIKKYGPNLISD